MVERKIKKLFDRIIDFLFEIMTDKDIIEQKVRRKIRWRKKDWKNQ